MLTIINYTSIDIFLMYTFKVYLAQPYYINMLHVTTEVLVCSDRT